MRCRAARCTRQLLAAAGIAAAGWLPLSLVPDATARLAARRHSADGGIPRRASVPPAAAAAGLLAVLAGIAFCQVVLGLLQAAGGSDSSLYFGADGGRPFGTFANTNHFANYMAMAPGGYVWLAWMKLDAGRRGDRHQPHRRARRGARWRSGSPARVLLVVGILMSRSRGAAIARPARRPGRVASLALTVGAARDPGARRCCSSARPPRASGIALVGIDALVAALRRRAARRGRPAARPAGRHHAARAPADFWPLGRRLGNLCRGLPALPAGRASSGPPITRTRTTPRCCSKAASSPCC